MSERRYVATEVLDWATQVYDGSGKCTHSYPLYSAKEISESLGLSNPSVHALVPLAELEAMEQTKAEMLELIRKWHGLGVDDVQGEDDCNDIAEAIIAKAGGRE